MSASSESTARVHQPTNPAFWSFGEMKARPVADAARRPVVPQPVRQVLVQDLLARECATEDEAQHLGVGVELDQQVGVLGRQRLQPQPLGGEPRTSVCAQSAHSSRQPSTSEAVRDAGPV